MMPERQNASSGIKTAHKLPQAFTDRIRNQFPDDHAEFLNALDAVPATSIRINPHKWVHLAGFADFQNTHSDSINHFLGTDAVPIPWTHNGWFLKDRPSFTLDPLFHAGCYYVQEAGSMILEHILSLPELRRNSEVILDACAAPGGKSTLIAAMFPESLIVANEVIRSRIPPLLENSMKWGTGNLVITQNDPARFSALTSFFDLAVVDAPCSGEGLFRKNPASRQEWTPANAHHCTLRQRTILMDIWTAIKPGGHLIYTTCTFNPEENERNVAWLLEKTGGICEKVPFEVGAISRSPEFTPKEKTAGTTNQNFVWTDNPISEITEGPVTGYGIYPNLSRGEGFFVSVICKPAHDTGDSRATRPSFRAKHLAEPESAVLKNIDGWFEDDAKFRLFQINDRLFRIHENHWDLLNVLSSQLQVRYAGTEIAKIIRNDVRPATAAALDIHLTNGCFPRIECTRDDALRFLRRENISVPESADTGWHLAAFQGIPLGWLKNIGRRMNNYYPKEWRIRHL